MNDSSPPGAAQLIDRAIGEFKRAGEVKDTRCDQCQEPITVQQMGEHAYTIACRCGKFHGSVRGL